MKNWILLTTFLVLGWSLQAQSQREELVDLLAQETCTCLEEKDPAELSAGNLEMTVGLCILNSFSEHADDFPDLDLDIGSTSAMEQLGEEIGFRMFNYCPGILMQLATEGGLLEEEGDEIQMVAPPPPPPPASMIQATGTLERIDGKEIATVILRNSSGDRESFIWLNAFPGAHVLLGQQSQWEGSSVTIYAVEVELYNPTKGSYETYHQITELILLD